MQQAATELYKHTEKAIVDPRQLEANILAKAATKLQSALDTKTSDTTNMRDALTYNRKLWTIFVSSATEGKSALPRDLRQNIANLGIFVFGQTLEAELSGNKDLLRPLISINRELAAGLRS